jgi:hypothetical protein
VPLKSLRRTALPDRDLQTNAPMHDPSIYRASLARSLFPFPRPGPGRFIKNRLIVGRGTHALIISESRNERADRWSDLVAPRTGDARHTSSFRREKKDDPIVPCCILPSMDSWSKSITHDTISPRGQGNVQARRSVRCAPIPRAQGAGRLAAS